MTARGPSCLKVCRLPPAAAAAAVSCHPAETRLSPRAVPPYDLPFAEPPVLLAGPDSSLGSQLSPWRVRTPPPPPTFSPTIPSATMTSPSPRFAAAVPVAAAFVPVAPGGALTTTAGRRAHHAHAPTPRRLGARPPARRARLPAAAAAATAGRRRPPPVMALAADDAATLDDAAAVAAITEAAAAGRFHDAVTALAAAPRQLRLPASAATALLNAAAVVLPSSAKAVAATSATAGTPTAGPPAGSSSSAPPGATAADVAAMSDSADVTLLYATLQARGHLPAFGCAATTGSRPLVPRVVDAADLEVRAGLPIGALAPRRSTAVWWQLAGVGLVVGVNVLAAAAGVEGLAQPALAVLFLAWVADARLARGAAFETLYRAVKPEYAEKVLKHEAGHFLAAYLMGSPVRGYVLSAADALKAGIPGQAGTVFTDARLEAELQRGKLSGSALERFSIVLMAGIAAEALMYGQAEGGASDEAVLVGILGGISPPWPPAAVVNHARWAALEAILLLRQHATAYEALVDAMRDKRPLGECVAVIERHVTVPTPRVETPPAAAVAPPPTAQDVAATEERMAEREQELNERLAKINSKLEGM